MNFRLTVGLLIVLVLLVGALYAGGSPAAPNPTPVAKIKIFDFDAKDVTALAVNWAGQPMALKKGPDGKWQITQPEAAAADHDRVGNVLYALSGLNATRDVVVAPDQLAGYGLAAPQGAITVTLAAGPTQRLLVGSTNPDGSAYYTRKPTIDGDVTIRMAPASSVESLRQLVLQPPTAPTPTPPPALMTPQPSPTP